MVYYVADNLGGIMTHNILFVDDEEFILEAIKLAVSDEQYNCFFATSAKDGLGIMKNINIDVVVSDMIMPEIDGLSFLTQVEAISSDIIKIIQTGKADINQLINVINTIDVFNFMLKPYDIESTLKPILKKAVHQSWLVKTNKQLNNQLANKLRELEIKHYKLQKVTASLEDSNSIIMTIANAVETKDIITKGHVHRVAYWSEKIGERLALSNEEIELLKKASMLHDIGKILIPDDILYKPGPLTNEEFEIIKTHTIIGEKIIQSLKSFENVKSIVRHHHEKLDGSGYPDNLTDNQIDIYTRIVAIVDMYVALTTNKPYRNAMSHAQTFSILDEDSQKGFIDHQIVEILKEEVLKSPDIEFLDTETSFALS